MADPRTVPPSRSRAASSPARTPTTTSSVSGSPFESDRPLSAAIRRRVWSYLICRPSFYPHSPIHPTKRLMSNLGRCWDMGCYHSPSPFGSPLHACLHSARRRRGAWGDAEHGEAMQGSADPETSTPGTAYDLPPTAAIQFVSAPLRHRRGLFWLKPGRAGPA